MAKPDWLSSTDGNIVPPLQRGLSTVAASACPSAWQSPYKLLGASNLAWIVVVATAYVLSAQLGFAYAFATKQVTAVWPPVGIALAAFLWRGPKIWPGVLAGAFISNALLNEPIQTAAGIAVGNTAGPMLGAYLLHRVSQIDLSLSRLKDVLGLTVFGSVLAMIVPATNGVVNLAFGGLIPWSAVPSVGWVWWVGDAMGALLIAPVILTWASHPTLDWPRAKMVELGLALAILFFVSWLSFSAELPLAYPVFPALMWICLRFSQRETAFAVLVVATVAVWQTVHGQGPFTSGSLDNRLGLLVTFLAVLAITGLALGALATERSRAEASLRHANDQLEARVLARTAELERTNSQLASANTKLERRTAELARKNEEVEAFVYIVSHDLRAPLVNLQGFSRELELSCDELQAAVMEAAVPPETKTFVHSIVEDGIGGALKYIGSSVAKFERLINALLMLSRTGQQAYRIETIDMGALVATTLDSLRQTIDEADTTVVVGALPDTQGDMTAIGQVFSNLIGNALKYGQPGRRGHIEIAGTEDGAQCQYWVRDNGAGIPDSARERIFQVFQRFHPDLATGDGIGLAAIKRIIERHGGKIWVDSAMGEGSTFHFMLPKTQEEEA